MKSLPTTTREQPPLATTREKSTHSNKDPAQPKSKQVNKYLKKKKSTQGSSCLRLSQTKIIAKNVKLPLFPLNFC